MKLKRTNRLGAIFGVVLLAQLLIGCTQEAVAPPAATVQVPVTTEPVATHVVQRGDRLVDIAAEYNIPLARLIELNDVANPDVIEVGSVLLLEEPSTESPTSANAAPVATRAPLPRLVQIEAVEPSFGERLSEWWADAPKPALSGDAVQQGLFAAVVLPAAVVALFLLLIVGRLTVRLLRSMTRMAFGSSTRASAEAEQQQESGEAAVQPPDRRRLPSLAFVGVVGRRIAIATRGLATSIRAAGLGWLTRPLASVGRLLVALTRWASAITVRGARYLGSVLNLNARKAVGVHTARRERARDQEFQRESRGWWSQGRERLRIGLLDEAEECFETGLRLAVDGGWQDEITLYRSELQLLAERRSVERSLVPSAPEL